MLRSPRLYLREFGDDDFDAVHAYATDPEVVRYMTWGPNSEAETRDFLGRAQSHTEVDPRVQYELAVIRGDSDQLIGGVGLHVEGAKAMLGYCFARPARRPSPSSRWSPLEAPATQPLRRTPLGSGSRRPRADYPDPRPHR